jgi:membrane protease YdiL (CAAX protease family)
LNKILRNKQGQLRNGWWILAFLAIFMASQLLYSPTSHWLQRHGATPAWLGPLPVFFVLLVTWAVLRLRRQPLSAVGLRLDGRWMRQALAGVAFGGAQMLVVTALICLVGGVRFGLDPAGGIATLAMGAWLFLWAALLEELLFRGFVFQRLLDGIGVVPAQLAMAALFAVAHWGNPGMDGATEVWASLDLALAAVLLGLAYVRTGSLALSVGMHFGWNWTQGSILGFDVSGMHQGGWLLPHLLDKPQWLTGGAFGPEASIFAVAVDLAAILVLWRWKGIARTREVS